METTVTISLKEFNRLNKVVKASSAGKVCIQYDSLFPEGSQHFGFVNILNPDEAIMECKKHNDYLTMELETVKRFSVFQFLKWKRS